MVDKTEHIHRAHDNRGVRDVYCSGRLVEGCFFADTKKGIVDCYRSPRKIHKYRKRLITQRQRGKVEVVFRGR